MPGKKYKSIKKPRLYEKLKKKGYSKEKAARISNAVANGTVDRSGARKGRRKSRRKRR